MLTVRDVAVSFDGTVVLDGVTLDVADGETVALLGPSGSGKSTLLRVVAGIVRPDRGSVTIDGTDVTEVATHRRGVGMVFQDEQLFPHLDVGANVAFGLRMAGVPKAERRERVARLLGLVGLDGFAGRSIERLSGGEAKRVALARSLAPTPAVLLLDEPLSGLDQDLRIRLAGELGAVLRSTRTTSIWVTHDVEEAELVADRVVRLGDL
ncbi:MAG: ABC transporter ATP-binding protein [Ilumatobacteraceae bacterium]|nr:ABC transporter ATP-binding protein [Ilumatobacteraceae bacterium]